MVICVHSSYTAHLQGHHSLAAPAVLHAHPHPKPAARYPQSHRLHLNCMTHEHTIVYPRSCVILCCRLCVQASGCVSGVLLTSGGMVESTVQALCAPSALVGAADGVEVPCAETQLIETVATSPPL